jgi:hypothetical protein
MQNRHRMVTAAVGFFQGSRDVYCDIDPDLINQPQRSHRHAPLDERLIDLSNGDAAFEQFRGIKQVWKQHSIDQKPWPVAHHHRQLADLSGKTESSLTGFFRCPVAHHHFNQLHSADWIKKMQAHNALGRPSLLGQFLNW